MGIRYSEEFKLNAIKRCIEYDLTAAQAARELGVNANTMRHWLKMYKQNPTEPFVGSGNLHEEDQQIRGKRQTVST